MRAVDTNVLVYAFDAASPRQSLVLRLLKELAEGGSPWVLPWPCVYEFLRVVTHPRSAFHPVSSGEAWRRLKPFFSSPSLILLSETERHAAVLESLLIRSGVTGNLVHDAHIAALLIEHGVREIVTADEDFRRFEELTVINPFRG